MRVYYNKNKIEIHTDSWIEATYIKNFHKGNAELKDEKDDGDIVTLVIKKPIKKTE